MIPHKAISNALLWQWQTYHVGNADRILFHTPSSYQSRIWDLFLPLIAGSRLVIDPQDRIEDTDDLIDFLVNQEVTLVQSTPSKLSKFLDSNIGTPGSLRGVTDYFRNPDLTATRFVPDPFADEPGARLFKTGDRAKFLEDGTIAFMGRLDRQSKIR